MKDDEKWYDTVSKFALFGLLLWAIMIVYVILKKENSYVDQHTMWMNGELYLYTFIYKDGDIHSFEKDSIHLVNDSIKEVRYKTAEETLKTLRWKN